MRKTGSIGELREKFCEMHNVKVARVRLILNGQRLDDENTLDALQLNDGDVIDAFEELRGGGPPSKRNIFGNNKEILEVLDAVQDTDGTSSDSSMDMIDEDKIELTDTESKKIEESEMKDTRSQNTLWIEELRDKFQNGELKATNDFHNQIIFYLQLPKLSLVETDILKRLVDRLEMYSDWEREKNKMYPVAHKQRKRTTKTHTTSLRNLRSMKNVQTSSNENSKLREVQEKAASKESNEFENNEIEEYEIENELKQTSSQSKTLSEKFGILSPILKQKQVTEEEVRRFSLAVHLWADRVHGDVSVLQKKHLTDRDFKDILIFAGAASTWKLIQDRSTGQFKSIWRNSINGNQHYQGHFETGFETKQQVHDPAIPFCPFGHCSLNYDDKNKSPEIIKIERNNKKPSRKLFTPEITATDERNHETVESYQNVMPSPTKEELKQMNKKLQQKVNEFERSNSKKTEEKETVNLNIEQFLRPKLVKCTRPNCEKEFGTVFGLDQHMKKIHAEESDGKKTKLECPFCGKWKVYIDQHIKAVHNEFTISSKCEVCKQNIKHDMKKHRSACIFCPFCTYQNKKKERLLKHIEKMHKEPIIQSEPLNLISPRKKSKNHEELNDEKESETNNNNDITIEKDMEFGHNMVVEIESNPLGSADDSLLQIKSDQYLKNTPELAVPTDSLVKKRLKYPFDKDGEPYSSEFEDEDTAEYTNARRKVKDELELILREVDECKAADEEGDNEVVSKFRKFMQNKTRRTQQNEGYLADVSTVQMYTSAVKNDILPAFHRLFEPFNSQWILDCTTPKECTFEGGRRSHVTLEEPIYMTSKILKEALDKSKENGGQTGGQRGTIVNAAVQFMNFVELFYNERLNMYGRVPYENVLIYHQGVKTFINGTGTWKMVNDEKDKAQNENKLRKDYQFPNQERDILKRYKDYLKSEERQKCLNKVLIQSEDEDKIPSDREMTELAKIIMGELVAATGCRPVVLLKLTLGAYVDKHPGFNPYEVSNDDRIVDEEDGDDKIYRRVDPNVPPTNRACVHQIENNTSECPEMCENACQPDGFNVYITWDKTYSSKGPSYLHIPKELKNMMDIYDIKRVRFFKGRKSQFTTKEDWIHDDNTPFFLNSAGSPFKSLDLKHITEVFGIDVTAYRFRKIVSTWALSHASKEIRGAEEEALQHSLKVAKAHYMQNKMIKPQRLTQKYIEEENLFPKSVREEISKAESRVKSTVKETEKKRTKKRLESLLDKKEAYKLLRLENKPLGPKHRILGKNRSRFLELVNMEREIEVEGFLDTMKPLQWRQFIVKTVCTAKDDEIRSLWKQMYQGDLKWGVRDVRMKAKEKNWPSKLETKRRDRNSWIAGSVRKSYLSNKTGKKGISQKLKRGNNE